MNKVELKKKLENLKSHLDNNKVQYLKELTDDKTKNYYLNKAIRLLVVKNNVIITLKSFDHNCKVYVFNERYNPITDEIINDLYIKYLKILKDREEYFNSKSSNDDKDNIEKVDAPFNRIKELQKIINQNKIKEKQYEEKIKLLEKSNKPLKLCNIIEYVKSTVKRQNTERR